MKKKTIHLTEEELKSLICECLNDILYKTDLNEANSLTPQSSRVSDRQSNIQLVNIEDKAEIDSCIGVVYNMLVRTYNTIDGFWGADSKNTLQEKTSLLTLYTNGVHIYSAGVYSFLHGGKKLFGVAHDETSIGKNGVHLILKRDIAEWKNWYWCEASGAVAHLCDKYGGIKIPSIYAAEILKIESTKIKIKDEYKYERAIAGNLCEKTIFGYKDEETYNKVNEQRDKEDSIDYSKIECDRINESVTDEDKRLENKIQWASHVVGTISDNVSAWKAFDLTPNQHQAILDSICILEKAPKNRVTQQALNLGKYMIDNYPIFTLHKF